MNNIFLDCCSKLLILAEAPVDGLEAIKGFDGLAELISLGLTVPLVVLALNVVRIYGVNALKTAVAISKKRSISSVEWLVLGIVVSFIGAIFDNLYWGAAWTAEYLDLEAKRALFSFGVYANIPFRQIAGMLAAYCHCVISEEEQKTNAKFVLVPRIFDDLSKIVWVSFVLAVLLILTLVTFKHFIL